MRAIVRGDELWDDVLNGLGGACQIIIVDRIHEIVHLLGAVDDAGPLDGADPVFECAVHVGGEWGFGEGWQYEGEGEACQI